MGIYLQWILGGLAAYLLGSIPFGFLIAKAKGVDIRQVGSGNIGATNVFRCVSKPLGILTFALDMGKGCAGCTLLPYAVAYALDQQTIDILPFRVVCGFLTVVGHNWTLFLGFKGGKGIATSAGLLLGWHPPPVAWHCWPGSWPSSQAATYRQRPLRRPRCWAPWPGHCISDRAAGGFQSCSTCWPCWQSGDIAPTSGGCAKGRNRGFSLRRGD